MSLVTVREHARLTTGPVEAGRLDVASIPVSAFDWLCREAQRMRGGGVPLVQVEDRRWLRLALMRSTAWPRSCRVRNCARIRR